MSKSLETRLNPQQQEVIEYTRLHGQWEAMERYGVRDYIGFTKWLERHAGNSNWGVMPVLGKSRAGNLGTDLLDAFLLKLRQLEAEKNMLAAKLAEVEAQLETYQCRAASEMEPRIAEMMKLCQPEQFQLKAARSRP